MLLLEPPSLSTRRLDAKGLNPLVGTVRRRYDNGLDQLNSAGEAVVSMQAELTDLKPKLIVAKEETETMQVKIDKEVQEVIEPKKVVVQAEEAATNEVAQRAKTMKEECEADLAEAIPALNSAVQVRRSTRP